MYSDKIWGRMDAGRRNQYKEGSNTQPMMEQQRRQQWACCSPSCNPCWDPGWGQQLSLAHASVNSSSPTIFSLQTLKHASMAAQTLPETSHFCTLPCPQCCWHWSSPAVEKKEEDRTHMCFSLLGEGAESAHGRTGEAPRPGQSYEVGAGCCRGWNAADKSKTREDEPIPASYQITFSHFSHPPWIRSWTVLVQRDKDYDQWTVPAWGL